MHSEKIIAKFLIPGMWSKMNFSIWCKNILLLNSYWGFLRENFPRWMTNSWLFLTVFKMLPNSNPLLPNGTSIAFQRWNVFLHHLEKCKSCIHRCGRVETLHFLPHDFPQNKNLVMIRFQGFGYRWSPEHLVYYMNRCVMMIIEDNHLWSFRYKNFINTPNHGLAFSSIGRS